MINHDFDKLKVLFKYCGYFFTKNNEFVRPGEYTLERDKNGY